MGILVGLWTTCSSGRRTNRLRKFVFTDGQTGGQTQDEQAVLKICLSSFHIRRSVRLGPFILPDDLFVFQSIATQQLRSVSARSHPAPHDHVHFITTGPQDSDLCKSFEESYSEVARRLAEEGSKVRLAKVDTTVERELRTKYVTDQDEERQTIKFFKEGLPITYHIKCTFQSYYIFSF